MNFSLDERRPFTVRCLDKEGMDYVYAATSAYEAIRMAEYSLNLRKKRETEIYPTRYGQALVYGDEHYWCRDDTRDMIEKRDLYNEFAEIENPNTLKATVEQELMKYIGSERMRNNILDVVGRLFMNKPNMRFRIEFPSRNFPSLSED